MPSLDIEQLVQQMAGAASGVLKTQWPEARRVAEPAFQKLGEAVTLIASEYDAGEISQQEAKMVIGMQRAGLRNVVLTVEGLDASAVERAIIAALEAAKPLINATVGFALL